MTLTMNDQLDKSADRLIELATRQAARIEALEAAAELMALHARIEMLEAALRKIADLMDSEAGEPLDDAIAIARAALDKGNPTK